MRFGDIQSSFTAVTLFAMFRRNISKPNWANLMFGLSPRFLVCIRSDYFSQSLPSFLSFLKRDVNYVFEINNFQFFLAKELFFIFLRETITSNRILQGHRIPFKVLARVNYVLPELSTMVMDNRF